MVPIIDSLMSMVLVPLKIMGAVLVGTMTFSFFYSQRDLDVDGIVVPMVAKYASKKVGEVPNSQLLNGTVILITGATNGIGLALTRHLCKNFGATVLAVGRSEEKLKSLCKEFPNNVKPFRADLSDLKSVSLAADTIRKSVDVIHILVNNAGINTGFSIKQTFAKSEYFEAKTAGLDNVFVTNYLSHFLLTEKLADLLQPNQKCGNAPPRIVQISSSFSVAVDGSALRLVVDSKGQKHPPLASQPGGYNGLAFFRGQQSYANSKLAQIIHTRALSKLKRNSVLASKRAQSISVCPLWVGTDIASELSIILKILAFPVNGWGISSSLHGMFEPLEEQDFMWNASLPKFYLPSNPASRDIVCFLISVVYLLIQKFYAQCEFTETSPESYDVKLINELYDWSLEAVTAYL